MLALSFFFLCPNCYARESFVTKDDSWTNDRRKKIRQLKGTRYFFMHDQGRIQEGARSRRKKTRQDRELRKEGKGKEGRKKTTNGQN